MDYRQSSPDLQHSSLAQQALTDVVQDGQSFFEDVGTQNPLESIEHFCRSHQSFQRLAYTHGIAAAASGPTAAYADCVEVLLPLVQQLARDPEAEIRATAVKQLPGLGTALFEKDAELSMRDIEATLLVCAQQCALDDDDEVSHASILAFQQLVQLLPSPRATAASKRAVDRLESHGSDDGTLAAVRLLAHTVGCWTPEALKRHVPRYISRWASHREFAVREAAANCMSLVLPAMPLRLCHQVLLPAFYQLSRDQNWRVRRACALDLPRLAAALQKRPAEVSSTPTADSSSSSCWQQEVEAEQPLGCCSSRASSCLDAMQRFSGDTSGSQFASSLAAASGPQRNRSYPSLANRSPATTAQIMTKHPMHSSLIMEGMLSSSSSCNSMTGSPSGGSDSNLLAQDSHDDACSSQTHQHHHHHHQQQQHRRQHGGSMSDNEQPDHPHQREQPQCRLEQTVPLLHDCWCALRQCMELLTADSSHWVKVAALSGLGPFLLQLPPCQLGMLLLGRFTAMAGSTVVIYEVSVALACAQAFGQLAVLLGPDRWHDMRDAWHALQASRDPAVLCEVVSCMPQLMAALGPVLTHREMFPALAGLLQSHLSWIGSQLVLVMADLFPLLPPSGHELLLKTLPQLASRSGDRSRSWRVRRELALQLGRLAVAAGPDAIENNLWPTAMSLCCDPVAAVRTAAASQIGPILAALPSHMLQTQLGGAGSCEACCSSRLGASPLLCQQPVRRPSCLGHAAGAELGRSAGAAAGSLAEQAANGHSSSAVDTQDGHASSSQDSSFGATASDPRDTAAGSSQDGVSDRRKARRSRFGVRFSVDDDEPTTSSSSAASGRSRGVGAQSTRPPSVLSGLVANQHQRSSGSISSSMDFDELGLPSALAPAPVGCFSALSDSDNESDGSDTAGDGSSGLSTSGSHSSSDGGSHHSDSSTDESGSDGSGSDADSEEDEESSSSSSRGAVGGVSQGLQGGEAAQAQQQQANGISSSGAGDDAAAVAEGSSADSDSTVTAVAAATAAATVAVPAKPLYAMHPAMMPVGAVTAAAAAARAVPITRRRQLPNRAKSMGDLLPLQSGASASNPEDNSGPLGDSVVARLKQQEGSGGRGRRQLADSLPSGLLAADGNSSDDEFSSSGGGWVRGLPQPAHAAPHQYLPVLVEYFGCSSSHQQRQLFVPVVMGLLAACHQVLSCAQQAVLLDRLEALAHDNVPGVRYAVAAALADVRTQAAALTGQQQQPQQQQEGEEQERATVEGANDGVQQQQPGTAAKPSEQVREEQGEGAADGVQRQQRSEAEDLPTEQPAQAQDAQQQQQQPVADSTSSTSCTTLSGAVLDTAAEQQEPHQQQQAEPEAVQKATSSPRRETQMVGHVPKGAHPLLGYKAYVMELARTSSGSSGGAAGSGNSSAGSSGRSSPSHGSSSSPGSSGNSSSGRSSAPGTATAALPPRSSSGPALSRQLVRPHSASGGVSGSSTRQQPAAAGHGQHQASSKVGTGSSSGGGGAGQTAGASAGAAPQASGAGADAAKSAEWLMKLSNCQQLERLMHVVALTTGPLCGV